MSIPPLPPDLDPEPVQERPPLTPLDPWPGEPLDLHTEYVRFATWWANGNGPRKGSGVLSAILAEARAQGVIRPGIRDRDAQTWSWLSRARSYRRELSDQIVAESADRAAAIHDRMLTVAAELVEVLDRSVSSARATGRVPKDEIASLEKLAKTAALLSGRPTARVGLDLSDAPTEALLKALAALDEGMSKSTD